MTCPVSYDESAGLWRVRDPELVRRVFADPERFSPANALTAHTRLGVRALRILSAAGFALPAVLANQTGPRHRSVRRVVARFFTPDRVDALEPVVRRLNAARWAAVRARLARGEEVDLVASVADDVPALVLLDLLAPDDVDVPELKRWSRDFLELFWGVPTPEEQERLARCAARYYTWLRQRASAARRSPGADLFGALVRHGLADDEVCSVAYFLLVAGHETTSMLISSALRLLSADPGTRAAVAADATRADQVVDTLQARESSVPTWRRVTREETVLGGTRLPAGAPLLLRITDTSDTGELAFGWGAHRCLGARLARMETRVAVQDAAAAMPEVEPVEPDPPMIDLLSFRAPERVRVRLRQDIRHGRGALPRTRPSTTQEPAA
ncbi:cytochrome P450 [Streptomyces heilongjiangensis]|uniref:Cytochrome P450 n=1 Tax=Streptomyces heilongjiangensis TaxID=945052 RepID=A0ABW1BAW7_9ACTN|nr:cytochrome P450 [Streptomyces heilongjiangensis]MDC2951158.1 cytochrome P450 [Streptomyces heilongjiangensis]